MYMFPQELVALDPGKSADLVVFHFTEEVQQIMSELQVNVQIYTGIVVFYNKTSQNILKRIWPPVEYLITLSLPFSFVFLG